MSAVVEESFIPSFISDINNLLLIPTNNEFQSGEETNRVERDLLELIKEYHHTNNLYEREKEGKGHAAGHEHLDVTLTQPMLSFEKAQQNQ